MGSLNGFIEEMVEGSKVVKVFNHEQVNFAEFEKEIKLYDKQLRKQLLIQEL